MSTSSVSKAWAQSEAQWDTCTKYSKGKDAKNAWKVRFKSSTKARAFNSWPSTRISSNHQKQPT
jgi:hypothetical protein